MTKEEAARILDPETSRDELWKHEADTRLEACNEACRMGADALREQQDRTDAGAVPGRWIPVTERLPDNEVDVLIAAEPWIGSRPMISLAFYTDGKMKDEDSLYNWDCDNLDMAYDEEADNYIVPEGWWESTTYTEQFGSVDSLVTHWMPLPEPPEDKLKGGEEG